mmetsp:Transcript_42899/g.134616  ORF Transcript_42899/g.134616 Transcript_42899/m.134616 type:complete len:83 (-) Transcript_42899:143-391(-)
MREVTFTYVDGPYAGTRVAFGYDVRAAPLARLFQPITVRTPAAMLKRYRNIFAKAKELYDGGGDGGGNGRKKKKDSTKAAPR